MNEATRDTPTRVLWLAKGLGRGGAERLLVEVASALRDAPVEIETGYVLPHKDALVPDLEAAGVRTHCLGTPDERGWWLRLKSLLHSNRYDVVHTHAPVIASAARVLAPRNLPLVHTEHNTWDRYRLPTRWANAVTIRRNSVVWPVSQGVADSIRMPPLPFSSPQVEVMLHGIAPGRIASGAAARAEARRRLGLAEDALAVVTVGNLTPKKDHDNLIAALDIVRRRHEVQLHIIGDGPQRGHLENLIGQLGLGGRVRLLGSRDDVAELLPAYDVFAMSSLHEGLSIALLEAMAAGVPVVATRVGGIPELVIDGRHGLLVPPQDSAALAGGLESLLDDPGLCDRLVTEARRRADDFGIERAAQRLARAYAELGVWRDLEATA